jgi:hypothetical protein
VKVADCCDPSSTDTLTYAKMIEMCVESTFATVCVRFAIADHFFWFGEDGLVELHCIKSPNQRSLITSLKVIISLLSETKSESESFTILFYGNPLNSARGLYSNNRNHCCGYQKYVYE